MISCFPLNDLTLARLRPPELPRLPRPRTALDSGRTEFRALISSGLDRNRFLFHIKCFFKQSILLWLTQYLSRRSSFFIPDVIAVFGLHYSCPLNLPNNNTGVVIVTFCHDSSIASSAVLEQIPPGSGDGSVVQTHTRCRAQLCSNPLNFIRDSGQDPRVSQDTEHVRLSSGGRARCQDGVAEG